MKTFVTRRTLSRLAGSTNVCQNGTENGTILVCGGWGTVLRRDYSHARRLSLDRRMCDVGQVGAIWEGRQI